MFSLMNSRRSYVSVLSTAMAGALAMSVGCAEAPTSVSAQDDNAPVAVATEAPNTNTTPASLSEVVVGSWLGQAMLDEAALEQKLLQLPADQQEQVFVIAENFLSTAMAMEFRNDGTIESDVEMKPIGEPPIRDSTIGQWRVTQVADDQLAVEMAELTADNSTIVTKRNFRFYPDRNAFVMSVPIPQELQGCEAVMIFERQSAVANVAQRTDNAQR